MTAPHRLPLRLSAAALCATLLLVPRIWTPGMPLVATARADASDASKTTVERLLQANFTDLSGKPTTLAAYRGQTVVVNFWASWCNPCVHEMPALDKMSHSYGKKGIRFVGIAIDSLDNVRQFTQKTKISYPLVVAGADGGELMQRLGDGLGGLPFTVVIDKHGVIRSTHVGALKPDQFAKSLDGL